MRIIELLNRGEVSSLNNTIYFYLNHICCSCFDRMIAIYKKQHSTMLMVNKTVYLFSVLINIVCTYFLDCCSV